MGIDALAKLVAPPSSPLGALAHRATSEQLLGYSLPASAWEVIERYGDGSWADYLIMPSPHHAEGRDALAERIEDARAVLPDARLLAFSEDDVWVVATEGDEVSVVANGEPREMGMTFPALLTAWLSGQTDCLPPLAELTSDPSVPPFFKRSWDGARPAHLFEVFVRGEGDVAARWTHLTSVLGAHETWMRLHTGEHHQVRVYVNDLELNLLFTGSSMHVWCYDDRLAEVRARLERAVREAGLVVHHVRPPRDFDHGFAITG
jgi:hypothetical protein